MPTLLVHPDVHAYLAKLDVSVRDFIRQKVLWTETQLAMTGRASRVKGTRTQAWRRTPVRGNQYYLWWAPAEEVGATSPDLGPTIAVRDLRHHDNLTPPTPAQCADYEVVHPRQLDPRTALQTSVAKGAPPSGIGATIVRGQPGTGKTLALLYTARDLAASQRILYITYTPQLVDDALLFAESVGISDQVVVMTLATLEKAILRESQEALAESPHALSQRFDAMVRGLDSSVVGPWSNKGQALWAEARASLVGMALPFAWRRGQLTIPPREILDFSTYRDISGLDEHAAECARHIADIARRRGLLSDQTRARAALDALMNGQTGNLPIDGVRAVLLDEAQDLTPIELALLLELPRVIAQRDRAALFIAAGDESQTVHPSGFAWGIAKDLIHERLGREPKDITLGTMMRSPSAIRTIIKKTGDLYKTLPKTFRPSGAVADDAPTSDDAGQVLQCQLPQNVSLGTMLETLAMSPGRALITLDNSLTPDKGVRSPSAAVTFTPAEIKGLERRIVVVTGLDETLGALHRLTTRSGHEHRSLESLEARYLIDGIRVALSRATDTLVLLRNDFDTESSSQSPVDLVAGIESTPWPELLQWLHQDELSDEERCEGFVAEAREHVQRGDPRRALECLDRAEALGRDLSDATLLASIRELRQRLEKEAGLEIVVAEVGGDFTSLQEAINKAPAGACIHVRAGTYRGPFLIKKDLKIIGDGPRDSVVLEGDSAVVLLHSQNVTLEGLTIWRHKIEKSTPPKASSDMLEQIGQRMANALRTKAAETADDIVRKTGRADIAVAVENAKLHIRACDVRSEEGTGIFGIAADVHVEGCIVHHTTTAIIAGLRCSMTIEHTEINECVAGISANKGIRLVVRNSFVNQIEGVGILLGSLLEARIENNDIRNVKRFGISVGPSVTLVGRNRIHKCRTGIGVEKNGEGIIEENAITECQEAGIAVSMEGTPTVRGNRIQNGHKHGVYIARKGGGIFEDNQITGNGSTAIMAHEDNTIIVRGSVIRDNGKQGSSVYIGRGTVGVFEDNDVSGTQDPKGFGVWVHAGTDFMMRKNRIHHNPDQGIFCIGTGCVIEDNEIFENAKVGLCIADEGSATVLRNRIHANDIGIQVRHGASGVFEGNDVYKQRLVGILIYKALGTFRKNRIRKAPRFGVLIRGESEPLFEDNEISEGGNSNEAANVSVRDGANPILRNNKIHGGAIGVLFSGKAQGVAEGNEIASFSRVGVFVMEGSTSIIRRNRIHEARDYGVLVENSNVTIENNEIFKNREAGICSMNSDLVVRGNRIRDNNGAGIALEPHAKGAFERNQIIGNLKWGVLVGREANPTMRNNLIQGSPLGIVICRAASGTYIENDCRGNKKTGLLVDPRSTPVRNEGNLLEGVPMVAGTDEHRLTTGAHRGNKAKKGRGK